MLTADGFDDAILGIADRGPGNPVVAYDFDKCVKILIERDGMEPEEAVEYMDFNVTGAWLGDQTPIFVHLGQPFACN
jgi:hypothetical protein|tara:strand:+ start:1037 stop:1267 length:231 start_codon:yes stop_codon:yes gene_type:complete